MSNVTQDEAESLRKEIDAKLWELWNVYRNDRRLSRRCDAVNAVRDAVPEILKRHYGDWTE